MGSKRIRPTGPYDAQWRGPSDWVSDVADLLERDVDRAPLNRDGLRLPI